MDQSRELQDFPLSLHERKAVESYINAVRLASGGSPMEEPDVMQDSIGFVERATQEYHDQLQDPLPVKFNYDRWLSQGPNFWTLDRF